MTLRKVVFLRPVAIRQGCSLHCSQSGARGAHCTCRGEHQSAAERIQIGQGCTPTRSTSGAHHNGSTDWQPWGAPHLEENMCWAQALQQPHKQAFKLSKCPALCMLVQ